VDAAFSVLRRFFHMPAPWLWGVIMGLCIGGGVVLVSAIRYGFSVPLLVLGLVCAVVFGGLAFMSLFVRERTQVD
jgi:hypothetical protein